ncbi:hypothetical protein MPTK1_7g11360 [Marchantia polymorpha subsp. ruderalis]|uniref:Uncharacterized protein n=2 Tax=Marchantia polymorpha TaxID=3197 RepID=A0AAF6BYE1_MARPO|nr:hypothetical protein MARPO_0003s0150 [Marchantia polymorpha]BBN17025.1 hypothetical protein Mp_7g11360 [Marchantia polymorpha subsp. ruderalis]|eukprot:PTQ49262.1 hypothetical protein MARPO_0003s0150 [Marchantia polymorpha]
MCLGNIPSEAPSPPADGCQPVARSGGPMEALATAAEPCPKVDSRRMYRPRRAPDRERKGSGHSPPKPSNSAMQAQCKEGRKQTDCQGKLLSTGRAGQGRAGREEDDDDDSRWR